MGNSILKPSELLQFAVDGKIEESSDLQLTDIIENERVKDPITNDEAILQSADSSTKEGIAHLKSDMLEESVPPIINVNVETSPIQVTREKSNNSETFISKENSTIDTQKDKSNPSEYITNTYITNIEAAKKDDQVLNVNAKPSEIVEAESETTNKSNIEQDKAQEVKVVSDGTPIPVELIRDNTKPDKEQKLDTPAKLEEVTNTKTETNAKNSTEATDYTKNSTEITNNSILNEVVQPTKSDESKSITDKLIVEEDEPTKTDSPRVVREFTSLDNMFTGANEIGEQSERSKPLTSVDYDLEPKIKNDSNFGVSEIMTEQIAATFDKLTEEMGARTLETYTNYNNGIIDKSNNNSNEITNDKITKSNEIFTSTIDKVVSPITVATTDISNGITNLTESIAANTKTIENQNSQFNLIESDNITNNNNSRIEENKTEISELKDNARIQTAESKLTKDLRNSILITPEEKKLTEVNDSLMQVRSALIKVSETQTINNQLITNNDKSVITNTSNNEQILTENKLNAEDEVKKEKVIQVNTNSNALSEQLLQGIYDALVSSGIKIKGF